MSNVSTRHNVLPFVAGKSEPLSGQRLAKIGYKQTAAMTKAGEIAPTSVCASIPFFTNEALIENAQKLLPMLREVVQKNQDELIRNLYESRGAKPELLTSVSDDEISIDAIIGFFSSESNGGRITKEYLEQWFTEQMSDSLTVAIADKLGCSDVDDVRISQALAGYKELFVSLSGTKTMLGTPQIEQLRKVIGICGLDNSEDSVVTWANKRLAEMDKKNANLSALF